MQNTRPTGLKAFSSQAWRAQDTHRITSYEGGGDVGTELQSMVARPCVCQGSESWLGTEGKHGFCG